MDRCWILLDIIEFRGACWLNESKFLVFYSVLQKEPEENEGKLGAKDSYGVVINDDSPNGNQLELTSYLPPIKEKTPSNLNTFNMRYSNSPPNLNFDHHQVDPKFVTVHYNVDRNSTPSKLLST